MRGENETSKWAAIWSLRATLRPKAFDTFSHCSPADASVLRLVGLKDLIDSDLSDREIKRQLQAQLKRLETTLPSRRGPLFQGVDRLGKMMGLTGADKEIFLFTLLFGEEEGLEQAVNNLSGLNMKQLITELSQILRIQPADIARSLHREAPLSSSGLLQIKKGHSLCVTQHLELLDGLSTEALEEGLTRTFSQYFYEGEEPRLQPGDFAHLHKELSILYPFLKKALQEKPPGVNILIYGPPGTGKPSWQDSSRAIWAPTSMKSAAKMRTVTRRLETAVSAPIFCARSFSATRPIA